MDRKVILITGASGDLGTAMVNHFLSLNLCVVAQVHNRPHVFIEQPNLKIVRCDLLVENEVESLLKIVFETFKRLDFLVNNAGISKSSISWKTSLEDWNQTIAVNLTAPFLVSKHAIPLMRENNFGKIVHISSVVGQIGEIGTCAYAASKAGLFGLAKTQAKELASFNIQVNCIALGYFNTGMISQLSEEQKINTIAQIPMKSLGDPSTICQTLEYLFGSGGNYTTGQVINLNGGLL